MPAEKTKARSKLWQNLDSLDSRLDTIETLKWEDLRFPAIGRNIDVSAGRIDYDFAELGVGFANNTRYTEEMVGHIIQLPHAWAEGSEINPHIHWIQAQAAVPNWMIEYRVYNNGDTPPVSWTQAITNTPAFTYTSGSIAQISGFSSISMTGLTVSCMVDIKLYRDTGNVSTLFSGADPVNTTVLLKEFDIHYQSDARGSVVEYTK